MDVSKIIEDRMLDLLNQVETMKWSFQALNAALQEVYDAMYNIDTCNEYLSDVSEMLASIEDMERETLKTLLISNNEKLLEEYFKGDV